MESHSEHLRLVAYLRVSTDAQADEGYGLEVQEQAVDRWAASREWPIVEYFVDEGVSGTVEAINRDGLSWALNAIEVGKADGLVVARLDRLARRLTIQEAVLAHVWQRGGRVFTADGDEVLPDDPDDPLRTALRQIVGVFGELERGMISKRLRDGRRAKAAKGGYVAGSPPYGWRAEDGELVIDGHEQAVIERMVALRDGGASLRTIASTLDAEGLSPKRAVRWSPSAVSRVLDPEARKRARGYARRVRVRARSVPRFA